MSAWWLEAACRGRDTRLWFAERGDPMSVAVAKAVCRGCPVRQACLLEALEVEGQGERFGVRGGLTPDERDALARAQRARVAG